MDTLLVRLSVLALDGIVVTQVLSLTALASTLFTLTFALTVSLWLVTAVRRISSRNLLVLWLMLLSGFSVGLNALLTGTAVTPPYLKKLIMFWSTLLLLGAAAEYEPDRADVRFVLGCNTALAVFLTVLFLLRREQMFLINGLVTPYLTFRFTNPNLAAVFLSAVCILELIAAAADGTRRGQWGHILLAAVLGVFVGLTRARNARLLLGVFCLVYGLMGLFPRWKPCLRRWMALLLSLGPLLFAAAYLLMIHSPGVREGLDFLAGEGKGLDSRVEIWRFALEAVHNTCFLGAYSQISGGTGASQMHNSHLDILASYGVVVLALVCVLLAWVLCDPRHRQKRRLPFLCRMGFGAMVLSGLGEAMLFSGGMGVYLFAGIMLLLANYDEKERTKDHEAPVSQQLL